MYIHVHVHPACLTHYTYMHIPRLRLCTHTLSLFLSLSLFSPYPSSTYHFHAHTHTRAVVTLSVLEVVPPQWPDLVLTTNVPHSKADVLVLDCLHIETYTKGKPHSQSGVDKHTCSNTTGISFPPPFTESHIATYALYSLYPSFPHIFIG